MSTLTFDFAVRPKSLGLSVVSPSKACEIRNRLGHKGMAAIITLRHRNAHLPSRSRLSEILGGALLSVCILMFVADSNGRSAERATDWQPSMQAEAWDFLFSPGMPEHPTKADDGWALSFPRYEGPLPCHAPVARDCPNVEYLTTEAGALAVGQAISMTVVISGSPEFRYKT